MINYYYLYLYMYPFCHLNIFILNFIRSYTILNIPRSSKDNPLKFMFILEAQIHLAINSLQIYFTNF